MISGTLLATGFGASVCFLWRIGCGADGLRSLTNGSGLLSVTSGVDSNMVDDAFSGLIFCESGAAAMVPAGELVAEGVQGSCVTPSALGGVASTRLRRRCRFAGDELVGPGISLTCGDGCDETGEAEAPIWLTTDSLRSESCPAWRT